MIIMPTGQFRLKCARDQALAGTQMAEGVNRQLRKRHLKRLVEHFAERHPKRAAQTASASRLRSGRPSMAAGNRGCRPFFWRLIVTRSPTTLPNARSARSPSAPGTGCSPDRREVANAPPRSVRSSRPPRSTATGQPRAGTSLCPGTGQPSSLPSAWRHDRPDRADSHHTR